METEKKKSGLKRDDSEQMRGETKTEDRGMELQTLSRVKTLATLYRDNSYNL